jgi:DNA-binding transcriptional ArsR family regulator
MNESKVGTIDVQNGTGYYLKLDELSPPAILMCAALENPHMREILELLYQHPHLTRHQIAQHLGKSPDTIYWHLTNLDSSLLTVQKKRGGHLYSLSPEAGRIYTELTHHWIP